MTGFELTEPVLAANYIVACPKPQNRKIILSFTFKLLHELLIVANIRGRDGALLKYISFASISLISLRGPVKTH